jgi:hypothetical protein
MFEPRWFQTNIFLLFFPQPDYGDALHSIDLATFATPTQPTETTVIVAAMAFLPSFNTSFEAGFPTPPHQSPNYSLNYNFMYSPSFIQSSSSSPASSSDFEQDHYGGDCSSSSNSEYERAVQSELPG